MAPPDLDPRVAFVYDALSQRLQKPVQAGRRINPLHHLVTQPRDPSTFNRLLSGIAGLAQSAARGYGDAVTGGAQGAARGQALTHAGLSMLAANNAPGGARGVGAIAQGALSGREYAQQAQVQQDARTQQMQQIQAIAQQLQLPVSVVAGHIAAGTLDELMTSRRPTVVAAGATMVGADGRPIYTGPTKPPEFTADQRILAQSLGVDLDNMNPAQAAQLATRMEQYRRAGATSVTLNTGGKVAEGLAQVAVAQYEKITGDAMSAIDMVRDFTTMRELLDSGINTGSLEATTQPLRALGASLGIADSDKLGREQAFRAISNRLALLQRQNMPGAMSDKDREFLQAQVPSMSNTVEGNRLLIEIGIAIAERQQAIADLFDAYLAEHPDAVGWRRTLTEWNRANPLDLSGIRQRAAGPFGGAR